MKRGMINLHTTLSHHFLDLPVADRICHIPADAPQDDIPLKMAALELDRHLLAPRNPRRQAYPRPLGPKLATEPNEETTYIKFARWMPPSS